MEFIVCVYGWVVWGVGMGNGGVMWSKFEWVAEFWMNNVKMADKWLVYVWWVEEGKGKGEWNEDGIVEKINEGMMLWNILFMVL